MLPSLLGAVELPPNSGDSVNSNVHRVLSSRALLSSFDYAYGFFYASLYRGGKESDPTHWKEIRGTRASRQLLVEFSASPSLFKSSPSTYLAFHVFIQITRNESLSYALTEITKITQNSQRNTCVNNQQQFIARSMMMKLCVRTQRGEIQSV